MVTARPSSPRPKEPDQLSGVRRPTSASSSPSAKGDRDAQHARKKVREVFDEVLVEDVTEDVQQENDTCEDDPMVDFGCPNNVWTQTTNHLFGKGPSLDDWYIAHSDSEDVSDAMRKEDDMLDETDYDPLCPSILFTTAEKTSFRRVWHSALVVKGLGGSHI
ncbi:hypothetical protein LINGRAHAP2_LOCUS2209 [Linum grandiflorum]